MVAGASMKPSNAVAAFKAEAIKRKRSKKKMFIQRSAAIFFALPFGNVALTFM
jgi:hypothetical protein